MRVIIPGNCNFLSLKSRQSQYSLVYPYSYYKVSDTVLNNSDTGDAVIIKTISHPVLVVYIFHRRQANKLKYSHFCCNTSHASNICQLSQFIAWVMNHIHPQSVTTFRWLFQIALLPPLHNNLQGTTLPTDAHFHKCISRLCPGKAPYLLHC